MKRRTFDILIQLVESEYPISIKNLAKNYNVSPRTISNDLVEINCFLKESDFSNVINIRNKGYLFTGSIEEVETIKKQVRNKLQKTYYSSEERILDMLLSISLEDSKVFAFQKQEEFLVSKSTIDDDMRQLRRLLDKYDIEIVSNNKEGFDLRGNEHVIRIFLVNLLSQKLNTGYRIKKIKENILFNKVIQNFIPIDLFSLVNSIYEKSLGIIEDNVYKFNQILFSTVSILRIQKGCFIDLEKYRFDNNLSNYSEYINLLVQSFNLSMKQGEIEYLDYILETLSSKTLINNKEWIESQIISLELYALIDNELSIYDNSSWSRIQSNLQTHIVSLLRRMKTDTQIVNPLKEEILREYPEVFNIIREYFNEYFPNKITDDEVAYLTTYFSIFFNVKQKDNLFFNATVVCNYGMATGYLIKEKLESLFNVNVIEVISVEKMKSINSNTEIIFSTIKIEETNHPTLVINPHFNEQTVFRVQNFLNSHRKIKKTSQQFDNLFSNILLTLKKNKIPVTSELITQIQNDFKISGFNLSYNDKYKLKLSDVLLDNHILLNIESNNWEDAIEKASNPLLMNGVITSDYIKKMIDSVYDYGPYIVVAPKLALAHARPEDGAQTLGLSVATFSKPVKFGNSSDKLVQIIFCLSIIDSYSHLTIMNELVHLINDTKRLDELIKSETVDEFKNILLQK